MPIYEYRCEQCGHEMERLQRMSDDPLTDCPACEQPQLRRLVSAAGFRLKGSGWYETDFKGGSKRNLAESGNEKAAEKSGENTGSEGSADKKKDAAKKTEHAPAAKKSTAESGSASQSKTTA